VTPKYAGTPIRRYADTFPPGMDLAPALRGNFKSTAEVISNEILSAFWKAFRLGATDPGC